MKIFIDAGHNDKNVDTGAIGNGLREQDITFAVSHLLKDKLESVGVEVMVSRETKDVILGHDLNSSLKKRSEMANNWKADLFISIHTNSFSNSKANGTEVYTYNTSSKAYPLAEKVCKALVKSLGTTDRGTKTSNFSVLRNTIMPAMLIEIAFISNASDALKLKNNQDDIANVIFNEICDYYRLDKTGKEMEYPSFEDAVDKLTRKGIILETDKWKTKKWGQADVEWLIRKTAKYIGG